MRDRSSKSSTREFDAFVRRAAPSLLRTTYLITWSLPEAEDLVQEALLRTAQRWPSVSVMEFPLAYARRTVVNLALRHADRLGGRNGQGTLPTPHSIDDREDARFENNLKMIDTRSELLWLLGELPPRQRLVIVLRFFEDMTEAEIAKQLDWPIGTVKSTSSRALAVSNYELRLRAKPLTATPTYRMKGIKHDKCL